MTKYPKQIAFSNASGIDGSLRGKTNSGECLTGGGGNNATFDTIEQCPHREAPIYQLIGVIKRVEESVELPFERDQIVEDDYGTKHRILAVDVKSTHGRPIVSACLDDGGVYRFDPNGNNVAVRLRLLKNKAPSKSIVKFVPISEL
jgi:hypothetical protein